MIFASEIAWNVALIRHACALTFIREYAGANRGEGVEAMQSSTGNEPPAYWCCSFVYRCVRKMLGRVLLKSASCQEQREYAKRKGALRTRAQFDALAAANPLAVLGWVFLAIDKNDHAHHTGLVGAVKLDDSIVAALADGFVTVEGNAADPEKPASRDGNGAWAGRLRGNRKALRFTFNTARDYAADVSTYEFIDLAAIAA